VLIVVLGLGLGFVDVEDFREALSDAKHYLMYRVLLFAGGNVLVPFTISDPSWSLYNYHAS
jgi:hypothetical protein